MSSSNATAAVIKQGNQSKTTKTEDGKHNTNKATTSLHPNGTSSQPHMANSHCGNVETVHASSTKADLK